MGADFESSFLFMFYVAALHIYLCKYQVVMPSMRMDEFFFFSVESENVNNVG